MGPAVATEEAVAALRDAGMNVARLNCSHGDWRQKCDFIKWIRQLHDGYSPIAIMADLQGPKFRIADLAGGVVNLATGSDTTMGHGSGAVIPMHDDEIWDAMRKGDRVLFGDGEVEVRLGDQSGGVFDAKVVTGGKVKSRQGITLMGRSFDVGCLTDKDLEDLAQAASFDVDYIALSYVRRGEDMRKLRERVSKLDPSIRLIAKIETKDALHNLDDVIESSDAVMVARGDLGLQMDLEDVPLAQKRIIRKAHLAGKPVITATQMLESMVVNGRPTRAEVSDVANAILDGTDAVMLSGETANGAYPVEAVRTMARVAEKAETLVDPRDYSDDTDERPRRDETTEAVALAAVTIANALRVKAILTMSETGHTPRMVAKYRPKAPIYCASWNTRTQSLNALVWGVDSMMMPPTDNTDEAVAHLIEVFRQRKMVKPGDRVVVTAGIPRGIPGNTNMVLVKTV